MIRVGHGFDVHCLTEGSGVILGGVKIPCQKSIVAHSDGDVVIHALCDALLGALGLGDIGQYFPDTDVAYKNANSLLFLEKIAALVDENNYCIQHIDITIIAQTPKLMPYKEKMRQLLADFLKVKLASINVKATTHEGLDAIGQEKGIATHALVTLMHNDMKLKLGIEC